MKRKIALLLLMIIAVAAILVACNQTEATKILIRWENDAPNETYTFRVSLADFADDNSDGKVFKTYKDKNLYNGVTFTKDVAIPGEIFSSRDEIMPYAVDGSYSMEIVKSATDRWVVTTEQTLYVQYNKVSKSQRGEEVRLTERDGWQELKALMASDEEIAATSLEKADDKVILKSVIKTSVTFADNTQKPFNSETISDGFYVGVAKQTASKYTVKTEYDYSGKRPIAKVTVNDETTEYKLGRNASFIDSNQLLTYIRSLEKTETSFQDNPAVQVFDPTTGELVVARFGFVYNSPMVITDSVNNREQKVSVNAVYVTLNGMAYLVQENIPDKAKDANGNIIDTMQASDTHKYTTIRFRSGYLSYEFSKYVDSVWNALAYPQTTAE